MTHSQVVKRSFFSPPFPSISSTEESRGRAARGRPCCCRRCCLPAALARGTLDGCLWFGGSLVSSSSTTAVTPRPQQSCQRCYYAAKQPSIRPSIRIQLNALPIQHGRPRHPIQHSHLEIVGKRLMRQKQKTVILDCLKWTFTSTTGKRDA